MRSVQTQVRFPLSSVKPLEQLLEYRTLCLDRTRQTLCGPVTRRTVSPVGAGPLAPAGTVEGLEYLRCRETGSLFLAQLPAWQTWAQLLEAVGRHRQSPGAFHSALTQSRAETVDLPKVEWIAQSLRMQGLRSATLLEVASPPMTFGRFLRQRGEFVQCLAADEMRLAHLGEVPPELKGRKVQAALLLESLDRVDDPAALLREVHPLLAAGGLLFVTALVASGFDLAVLGLHNLYLYPPDRANCFTLPALRVLLEQERFELIEVSTPGVLDLEIVGSHLARDPALPVTGFERALVQSDPKIRFAFQAFLQENGMSSFARCVARKRDDPDPGARDR